MIRQSAVLATAVFVSAAITFSVTAASADYQAHSAKTKIVKVKDDSFTPTSLSISKGGTVQWKWVNTTHSHRVKVKSGPVKFSSSKMSSGAFSHQFNTKGKYKIICTVHPDEMKQTLTVE